MLCACGRENRSDARFCDTCAAPLQPAAQMPGERRQLTALFCDLVEYTRLSHLIDEEDLHRIVQAYQQAVSRVLTRWDGHVELYVADGINAYFGYPHAHEDDAQRAVRAALEILHTVAAMNLDVMADTRRALPPLAVRIGIHTGIVVIGNLGSGEYGKRQALGVAMNVAARLQRVAAPQSVVMSQATERLVSGLFVSRDLGTPTLKGIDTPVRAFAVLGSTGMRARHAISSGAMVGREDPLRQLYASWQRARAGHGHSVLVVGDAGIGKSKLVRQFIEKLEQDGSGRGFEWRCSPFHTSTPFHPVIEGLEEYLGIERGASEAEIAARLRERSPAVWEDGAHDFDAMVKIVSRLVSPGEATGDDTMHHDTIAVRRSRTLDLLCALARAQARRAPAVMVVEDLHWADPSTLDLIRLLQQRTVDVPLLLVLTSRRDWTLHDAPAVETIELGPLTVEQCVTLFQTLAGPQLVPPFVRDELLARSDGVPLFVEELTRVLLESTASGVVDMVSTIPDTLQGLLLSRLDRLSPSALETMHTASALSREFRVDVLASVSGKDEAALRQDLDELERNGLIYPGRLPGDPYVFKHALVAETAYASMLHTEQRRLHAQIAERLSAAFPGVAKPQPEVLAHHLAEAGEIEAALDAWRQAADAAIARGAYQEAIKHCDRGLELLPQVAGDSLRVRREIELAESKGTALFSILGYAHPLVEQTFAHALSLCERDSSAPTLRALYGVWAVNVSRSNREAVQSLLPRFEALANTAEPVALLTMHANAGVFAFYSGDFSQCVLRTTEAARWYATSEHSAFLKRHGYGGGLYPFAYRMWALSILGRGEDAVAAEEELERLARAAENPYGAAIAGGFRVNLARDRRDVQATLDLADRQIAHARRQLLPFWEAPALCARGWARAHLGALDEGIAEINLGLQRLDTVGLRATYPYHLAGLSEALLLQHDLPGALGAARRGRAMSDASLDRFYVAELYRLEGDVLREMGELASAEEALAQAVAVASSQSASLFLDRTQNSLMRLHLAQGRDVAGGSLFTA